MSPKKSNARTLLVDLQREAKLATFDGQKFVLKPQPENPWQYDIPLEKCNDADLLAGWVAYLHEMSWAHPILIAQFARLVCASLKIDIAAAAEQALQYTCGKH